VISERAEEDVTRCLSAVAELLVLSVCLSVTKCIVALRVAVGSWTLYRHVPRRALPIHFFARFCCKMHRSATTQSEKPKPNRRNFRVWNSHG